MVPGDDSDDQQEKTSEYTPLSFDTNYVKVKLFSLWSVNDNNLEYEYKIYSDSP